MIENQNYNQNAKQYGFTKKAVLETIRQCKKENYLKDYLKDREKEVVDIMMALYDKDMLQAAYDHELREEGRREGERKGRQEMLKLLFELVDDKKLSMEEAAKKAGLPVEQFEKMKQEQAALASIR